ncbi:MAG: MmcQ/YjbR family DNA-binding protein [Bacteroidia bacterium]
MNVEEVRAFCLSLPHTTEDFPFDAETLAIRVAGKIFTLIPLEKPGSMNLKCDPERAIQLREEYDAIKPGYHMNKKYWNTVQFNSLTPILTKELIQHSYDLVFNSLSSKLKKELSTII